MPLQRFVYFSLLIVAAKIGAVAGAILAQRLRPQWSDGAAQRLHDRSISMFFLGLLDVAVLLVFLRLLSHAPRLQVVLIVFPVVAVVIGMSGWYRIVGSSGAASVSPERAVLHGGLLIELATVFPIVGQLIQGALIIPALGAGFLCFIPRRSPRRRTRTPPIPPPPDAPGET
jgi:hypothetical protein